MKEFILLFRGGFELVEHQSPDEFAATMQQWQKWLSDLVKVGKIVAAQPLLPAGESMSSGRRKSWSTGHLRRAKRFSAGS